MSNAEFLVKEAWNALGYWAERENSATTDMWRNHAKRRYEIWSDRYHAALKLRQAEIETQAESVFADWLRRARATA